MLKGTGALGLRANANRRRSKAEIREAKLEEARRAKVIENSLRELERMKDQQKLDKIQVQETQHTL